MKIKQSYAPYMVVGYYKMRRSNINRLEASGRTRELVEIWQPRRAAYTAMPRCGEHTPLAPVKGGSYSERETENNVMSVNRSLVLRKTACWWW